MATAYVLTALPHSADSASPFHVSVVVSPRLSPSGTLGDFPVFASWPASLAGAELILTDHTNVPFTVTRLDPGEEADWPLVFPPETPVLGFVPQSFEDRDWWTYPAGRMDQLAKVVHLVSLAGDPIDPPRPSRSALAVSIGRHADQIWRDRDRPGGGRLVGLDETRLTRFLDDTVRAKGEAFDDPVLAMLADVHRVRRFYERPESAQDPRPRPLPGAENKRPDPLDPDFHQRVALLGDQPTMLRALGLVIDLEVAELDRLAIARWLTARLVLDDGTDATLPTRVACQVDDGVFTTRPRGDDWNAGRLRLGDASRYAVLDLDPDASGLKLERFLVTTPRLNDSEANGDPVSAAPPALQAQGFLVARNDRLDQLETHLTEHQARASALANGAAPLLNSEDVNRGIRVEVWDQEAKAWHSLHRRSNVFTLAGQQQLVTDDEEGFLQGAAASQTPPERVAEGTTAKTYLGETLFGWSGWSLSAPHPAMRPEFRYEGPDGTGAERMERVGDPEPVTGPSPTNVVSMPKVRPGSLPRLRYGRSYAFRAWGVDLAGNSPPRLTAAGALVLEPGPAAFGAEPRGGAAADRQPDRAAIEAAAGELVTRAGATVPYRRLVEQWRADARGLDALAASPPDALDPATAARILISSLAGMELAADAQRLLMALLAERERRHLAVTRLGTAARAQRVRQAVRAIVDTDAPLLDAVVWQPAMLAVLAELAGGLALAADTVTPVRPLLRWRPVDPPAIVPRRAYGQGESVRHLVIRSGVDVTRDPVAGDTLTVVEPAAYANQVAASHPEILYHDTCERHLAPPRTSQPEAELHGRFDGAIGSTDPAAHRAALAAAVREAGTFLDRSIPSLTDPTDPIEVGYLRLEAGPDADPATLVDLDDLAPGDPLGPGQYLVADTDQLVLPYLPDPLAAGVSLRFPDAGEDRPALVFPDGVEGAVAPLHGIWPELEPYRLVLRAGAGAVGEISGNVIDLALPPGDTLRTVLASSLPDGSLDLLGLWRLLPAVVRNDPDVRQAALDGWLWALSPGEEVRFVHAVPRPLEVPRPTRLLVLRAPGSTSVVLFGAVDLDGRTTSRLDAEAAWTEMIDDPIQPAPAPQSFRAAAFNTEVGPAEDLLVLAGIDQTITLPSEGPVRLHASRHELGDTKHRVVEYRFRATSRFTEYFHPALVANPDDRTVLGPVVTLSLPNAARPPKPVVRELVPLFRWEQAPEPEQPFALRRTRRAGVRIYLERQWFATGDGELLAVICAPTASDAGLDQKVSQWGGDPVWVRQRGPAVRPMLLELDHLFHQAGFDDRDRAAYPLGPASSRTLVDVPGEPTVLVLGYAPQFDEGRGLHFVDVAIDPGSAFWPFVRLVVARYQPESLTGLHLSPTVRLDYLQVVPARTATLSRLAPDRARVVVTGPVGHRGESGADTLDSARPAIAASRRLIARLEERDPTIASDLGWTTRATVELRLEGFDPATWTAAWEGGLDLPDGLPYRQPGQSEDWRVTVEEVELFAADRPGERIAAPELRVVYADHLPL